MSLNRSAEEPGIFLAKTTPDLQEQEDQLRRELKQQGHRIIMGEILAHESQNLENTLNRVLQETRLSIHPIGRQYEPIVELQVEQAVQHSQKNGMKCVLWIPRGTNPHDKRQKQFLKLLREDTTGKRGVILLEPETPEVLKNDLQEVLQSGTPGAARVASKEEITDSARRLKVYFVQ